MLKLPYNLQTATRMSSALKSRATKLLKSSMAGIVQSALQLSTEEMMPC